MRYLATLLEPWATGGSYGELFDGVSNVHLTGKIAHFELGYIPESAEELKAAAAFLIANYTRSHMMRLPRALRKRKHIRGGLAFLARPVRQEGAAGNPISSSANTTSGTSRRCRITSSSSRRNIRGPVLGNSRILFLLRQSDRSDIEDLSQDFPIPEAVKDAVMSHPEPEKLIGKKFSQFTYYHTDERRPLIVTMRNVASRRCSTAHRAPARISTNARRRSEAHANVVEAIIANA